MKGTAIGFIAAGLALLMGTDFVFLGAVSLDKNLIVTPSFEAGGRPFEASYSIQLSCGRVEDIVYQQLHSH